MNTLIKVFAVMALIPLLVSGCASLSAQARQQEDVNGDALAGA